MGGIGCRFDLRRGMTWKEIEDAAHRDGRDLGAVFLALVEMLQDGRVKCVGGTYKLTADGFEYATLSN